MNDEAARRISPEAIRRWAKRSTEASFKLEGRVASQFVQATPEFEQMIHQAHEEAFSSRVPVPPLTDEEAHDVCIRLARLEGFAKWLVSLEEPEMDEQQWVNLDHIVERAKAALNLTIGPSR